MSYLLDIGGDLRMCMSNKFVDDDAGSYILRNTNLESSLRQTLIWKVH